MMRTTIPGSHVTHKLLRGPCFFGIYLLKKDPSIKSMTRAPVMVWDMSRDKQDSPYPAYDFIRRYAAGRRKIVWTSNTIDAHGDATWLTRACHTMTHLPRALLCTLHVYTTQLFVVVTEALRNPSHPQQLYDTASWESHAQNVLQKCPILPPHPQLAPVRDCLAAFQVLRKEKPHSAFDAWNEKRTALDKQFEQALTAARPYLSLDHAIEHERFKCSPGIVLYSQARALFRGQPSKYATVVQAVNKLAHYRQIMPYITSAGWKRLVTLFIQDLDRVFQKMPPSPTMFLYRGTKDLNLSRMRNDPSYLSTTLSKKVAIEFTDNETHSCVTRITVKRGSQVLPLLAVTRYHGELEVLLPRKGRTCSFQTMKKKNTESEHK